jgi:hypothetical protein
MAEESLSGWNSEWDKAVLEGTLHRMDASYDAEAGLILGSVGPEYSYQSNLRSQKVHPTRSSMDYALYLMESGDPLRMSRALDVLDRLEAFQDKDPKSKWYGLWSWYVEEPLSKMPAVDFNWADFNGATLLRIMFRHQLHLPAANAARMEEMIRRCCVSIQNRNVSMNYTNIACMGTFVTLAGALLLQDSALRSYAENRLRRFGAAIDQTGSFAEYNSPNYNKVDVQNLTNIMMFVKDPASLDLARKIHDRIWLHIAQHWHVPTRQIAAPMSRCYSNDLGDQIWIQKALNNELVFLGKEKIRSGAPQGNEDVASVDYSCPAHLRHFFRSLPEFRTHREIFLLGSTTGTPNADGPIAVEGTTYLTPSFCLGSINHSDFWNQRRPLMAFWGEPQHPVHCFQLKVVKDGYDFSSALLYAVQNEAAVLGQIAFRSDGGDRHISLDLVHDQKFTLSSMAVQLSFDMWESHWKLYSGDRDVTEHGGSLAVEMPLLIDTGKLQFAVKFLDPAFAAYTPQLHFAQGKGKAVLELLLLQTDKPVKLDWRDVKSAGCGIAILLGKGSGRSALADSLTDAHLRSADAPSQSVAAWKSPHGKLEVTAARNVGTIDFMDSVFRSQIDGRPVPMMRLSNARLV